MTEGETPRGQLAERLLSAYNDMPRGERRLADVLLEDVGAVRHFGAGDLAARAGVSKATAARLFRRLGYAGYRAVQREARSRSMPAPVNPVPRPGSPADLNPGSYLDAEIKHLVRSFEMLPAEAISQAVRLLRNGDKLWVVGFGEDYPVAHFARAMLIKLRPDIRMIPIGGFPVPEEFASITPADTVLAFGAGRRTAAFRNVVGSAARAGASVIIVTDVAQAGDNRAADVILRARSKGPSMFGSMTATVSILTYLCARLAALIGDPAMERLRRIEGIHFEWAEKDGEEP